MVAAYLIYAKKISVWYVIVYFIKNRDVLTHTSGSQEVLRPTSQNTASILSEKMMLSRSFSTHNMIPNTLLKQR